MMNIAACIPITLVAIVGTEDDEEGNTGDKYSHTVGVIKNFIALGDVEINQYEDNGGYDGGDSCSVDR